MSNLNLIDDLECLDVRERQALFTYCIALDPGQTTGVALIRDKSKPWAIETLQLEGDHHLDLHRFLFALRPKFVVCETFENRGQDAALLTSREYIGVVKVYQQLTRCDVIWQNSSTGKQFWKDERLHKCGLYTKGQKHARDATRHYAYWRVFKLGDKSILEGTRGSVTKLHIEQHSTVQELLQELQDTNLQSTQTD
jgi:hypothetical protein